MAKKIECDCCGKCFEPTKCRKIKLFRYTDIEHVNGSKDLLTADICDKCCDDYLNFMMPCQEEDNNE